ncbi:phosphatidylinositol-specific phospholipase C domain-containing protein [Streptomyces sp. DT171]
MSAALLAPGSAGAAGTDNDDAYRSLGKASHPDWMKDLANDTSLAALSLPGTHDTLALHGGAAVQTQENSGDSAKTLTAQLERGIRAIDIRVRVTENKYFTVHHGAIYQEANFDDVLSKAQAFLGQHKGETIVMRLKAECPIKGAGIVDCENDPKTVDQAKIESIFGEYVKKYPSLFYEASVKKGSQAAVPRLSQIRGKLVLGSFDSVGNAYGISSFNSNQEDHWAAPTVQKKWGYVKENVDRAVSGNKGELYVTYTSASKGLERLPFEYAAGYRQVQGGVTTDILGVNYQLMRYLNQGGANGGRVGIVMMDFPGWAPVQNIIDRNHDSIVKGGHQGIWLVNADKTYVNTKYNRCMVRGPEFDSSKTGGLVTQRQCQATAPSSHQWGAERPSSYDGKGYYWIKASNGKCLTVPYNEGTPPKAGTQLYWWGCETRWFSGNQLWNVIPTKVEAGGKSQSGYVFINNWTGLCLTVDPATASTAGGKVTQDVCPK